MFALLPTFYSLISQNPMSSKVLRLLDIAKTPEHKQEEIWSWLNDSAVSGFMDKAKHQGIISGPGLQLVAMFSFWNILILKVLACAKL